MRSMAVGEPRILEKVGNGTNRPPPPPSAVPSPAPLRFAGEDTHHSEQRSETLPESPAC